MINDFYARFGLNDDLRAYLRKVKKLTVYTCENALKFDPAKNIVIKSLQRDIDQYGAKPSGEYYENLSAVSRFIGSIINDKEMSVAQFYGILKDMKKRAAAQKKAHDRD